MKLLGARALALLIAGTAAPPFPAFGQADDPEYPLGRLRLPPIAVPASPFRLVDLSYSFTDDGSTVSAFETRVRAGAGIFLGGEVAGDRRGAFFDTQRFELGVTEEKGRYEIESSLRAPRWLVAIDAKRNDTAWAIAGDGDIRLSDDLELLVRYARDFDRSRFVPPPSGVPTTGEPPLPPTERLLQAASAGFVYQRGSRIELQGEARLERRRTEAAFDVDLRTYRLAGIWNRSPIELRAETAYERTSGRIDSDEVFVSILGAGELGGHVLVEGSTSQRWEPGVLRFEDDYRGALTFYFGRHRFARAGEAAARVRDLQRRANALGYNERRVYDVDGLRRFRERLGISSARRELEDALDELYRAEVRDRNVPRLGFELGLGSDRIAGVSTRSYRAFVSVPWRPSWPFSRNESAVEFVTAELARREEEFPAGILAVSTAAGVTVALNREMRLALRWERPGVTPEDIAKNAGRMSRITVSYEYALGR